MAVTTRKENDLKKKTEQQLKKQTPDSDPIEKLRLQCLSRGCNGILGLGKMFRIIDDDGNRKVDQKEFIKGLNDYGVRLSKDELSQIFNMFDRDASGAIDFDEFLISIRPPMSSSRQIMVLKAFEKLDKSGDGIVKVEDLEKVYDVSKNPKFLNGQSSKEELLKEYLKTWEIGGTIDGVVTKDEFLNYYSGLSASIDNDAYFDVMMRYAWKL